MCARNQTSALGMRASDADESNIMIRCEVCNQIFLPQTVDGVIFFYIEFLWRAVKKNCVFLRSNKVKIANVSG